MKKVKKNDLSLHGLEPGTEEYKRVEALLIKRICFSMERAAEIIMIRVWG